MEEQINNLGIKLHTALRKACDSTATSITYNAINLLNTKIWQDYLEHIIRYCRENQNSLVSAADMMFASLDYDLSLELIKEFRQTDQMAILNIFKCSFKLFDESDWLGYTAYLRE